MTPCHQLTIYNINYSIPSLHMPLSMPLSPLALSATLLYILPKCLSKCQMSQSAALVNKNHITHILGSPLLVPNTVPRQLHACTRHLKDPPCLCLCLVLLISLDSPP